MPLENQKVLLTKFNVTKEFFPSDPLWYAITESWKISLVDFFSIGCILNDYLRGTTGSLLKSVSFLGCWFTTTCYRRWTIFIHHHIHIYIYIYIHNWIERVFNTTWLILLVSCHKNWVHRCVFVFTLCVFCITYEIFLFL